MGEVEREGMMADIRNGGAWEYKRLTSVRVFSSGSNAGVEIEVRPPAGIGLLFRKGDRSLKRDGRRRDNAVRTGETGSGYTRKSKTGC